MAALSREKIVATALQLLDRVGFEALTTRLLARELGVQQPALYWHFKNKRDLADAMAAAMLSPDDWPGPHTPGLSPEEWLAARAHCLRASLSSHRDGALIHAGTSPEPDTYSGLEDRVAALVKHGLPPSDALCALLTVGRYTLGWVLEEQALTKRVETEDEQLSSATEPTLKRAVADLRKTSATAKFEFGLRCMIDGLLSKREKGRARKIDRRSAANAKPSQAKARRPRS